jgi:hypothetical protein
MAFDAMTLPQGSNFHLDSCLFRQFGLCNISQQSFSSDS